MNRKGIDMTSMMIGIVLIFMFIAAVTILVQQSTSITHEMTDKGKQSYRINVATHEIITAPCATISPGVYNIQAVKAGRLTCINTTAAFKFATSTNCNQGNTCVYVQRTPSQQPHSKIITESTYTDYKTSADTVLTIPIAIHNTTNQNQSSGHVEVALHG